MQTFKCTEEQIKVPIRSWLKQAKEKIMKMNIAKVESNEFIINI